MQGSVSRLQRLGERHFRAGENQFLECGSGRLDATAALDHDHLKVWHKATRTYLVFAQDYTEGPIARQEDPTQLEGFFPMPQPMYSLRTNGTWIPKPEFLMYQDQANELDIVVNRLRNLVNALKVRGVYDKAMDELAKISELYKAPDLTFMPIPDYRMLAEKGDWMR